MKKIVFVLMFLMVATMQSQDVITKNVGDFNELKVFDKIQVTLVKSNENKVEITGIKRRKIDIVHNGNLLKIRMFIDNIWDNNNTKVTVYYTQINKIDVNEGAKVKVEDVLTAETLDLRAQEGAGIKAELDAGFVYVKSISGGQIELDGVAKEQEVVVTSGGQYYGRDLRTKESQVKVNAGGTAEVNAKNYIKANTNAGGTIRIYGNPKEIDKQKFIAGKIVEVN